MPFLKQFSGIIFVLFFLNLPFYAQVKKESALTKKYSPPQLKQDGELMKNVVLAMHPVIGIYNSREYYSKLFDFFLDNLKDSLTEKQFRIKTKLIIDELHCGHTEALLSKAYYKEASKQTYNYSPYFFIPIKDKVFLLAALNKKKDTLMKRGAEIVAINGISVDSMLRYCKRFIGTDGYNQTGKDHYLQLGFNSFYPALFGRPDTFTVDYLSGKIVKTVKYATVKLKTIPPLPLVIKNDSLFKRYRLARMRYRFLDDENTTMHLKLEAFSRMRTKKAYRRIFRILKKNKTENLIIDLRNNGGGSLENCYNFLSYILDTAQTQTLRTAIKSYPYNKSTNFPISFKFMRFGLGLIAKKKTIKDMDNFVYTIKPRKNNHYDKKIFVLINGGSFSASCLVAAYLKANNKAIFIGEETAGTLEGCNAGITPFYILPNTKAKIRIPAFRIVHDVISKKTGRGIIPDYIIDYSIMDILSRKDLEILKVRELIKKLK
ncbi:MAG: S41 family peptidase [Bacteroidota bacterium]